jgi:hypothetical protein
MNGVHKGDGSGGMGIAEGMTERLLCHAKNILHNEGMTVMIKDEMIM